jgi:hypothetical protein
VARNLERQTWETIVPETDLDARVTLDLAGVPLAQALDKLAEQAGGIAGVCHAVYRSKNGLRRLADSLRRGSATCDGWTNLAPRLHTGLDAGFIKSLPPGALDALRQSLATLEASGVKVIRLGDGTFMASAGDAAEFAKAPAEGPRRAESGPGRSGNVIITSTGSVGANGGAAARQPLVVHTIKPGGSGEGVEVQEWSRERLTMEEELVSRLGHGLACEPTRASADAVARKVRARAATLYVLKRSAMPGAFGSFLQPINSLRGAAGGTATPANAEQALNRLESQARRDKVEQYLKLTPEQRARRLREAAGAK